MSVRDVNSAAQIAARIAKGWKPNRYLTNMSMAYFANPADHVATSIFSVGHRQFCPNMKKIHLDSVLRALGNPEEEVEMDETMRQRAVGPLARMLELAK